MIIVTRNSRGVASLALEGEEEARKEEVAVVGEIMAERDLQIQGNMDRSPRDNLWMVIIQSVS
jgi:hypothetical protein